MDNKVKVFILIIFCAFTSLAQVKPVPSPMGVIKVEEATVFVEPNFEAEVIQTLPERFELPMSRKVFAEAFHRVRLPNGKIGYINSAEIQIKRVNPGANSKAESSNKNKTKSNEAQPKAKNNKAEKQQDSARSRLKKISDTRYFSVGLNNLQYKENALGASRSANVSTLQLRLLGPDVLIDGLPTVLGISIATEAPAYYRETTGNAASGYLFLIDVGFLQPLTAASNAGLFVNYGAFLKYSRFQVAQNSTTSTKALSTLADSSLGVKFGLEYIMRITDATALSLGASYFLEKTQYLGLSATVQFQF